MGMHTMMMMTQAVKMREISHEICSLEARSLAWQYKIRRRRRRALRG